MDPSFSVVQDYLFHPRPRYRPFFRDVFVMAENDGSMLSVVQDYLRHTDWVRLSHDGGSSSSAAVPSPTLPAEEQDEEVEHECLQQDVFDWRKVLITVAEANVLLNREYLPTVTLKHHMRKPHAVYQAPTLQTASSERSRLFRVVNASNDIQQLACLLRTEGSTAAPALNSTFTVSLAVAEHVSVKSLQSVRHTDYQVGKIGPMDHFSHEDVFGDCSLHDGQNLSYCLSLILVSLFPMTHIKTKFSSISTPVHKTRRADV